MDSKSDIREEKTTEEFLRTILDCEERERERLATNIHDSIGNYLITIKMHLDTLTSKQPDNAIAQNIQMLVNDAIAECRCIAHNLMPPAIEIKNILVPLNSLCCNINSCGKINIRVECKKDTLLIDSSNIRLMIYRAIQELIHNAIKHSKSNQIVIAINQPDNIYVLEISVKDNGNGFPHDYTEGIGLKNLRSKLSIINGKLTIESNKNAKGATITLLIPIIDNPIY